MDCGRHLMRILVLTFTVVWFIRFVFSDYYCKKHDFGCQRFFKSNISKGFQPLTLMSRKAPIWLRSSNVKRNRMWSSFWELHLMRNVWMYFLAVHQHFGSYCSFRTWNVLIILVYFTIWGRKVVQIDCSILSNFLSLPDGILMQISYALVFHLFDLFVVATLLDQLALMLFLVCVSNSFVDPSFVLTQHHILYILLYHFHFHWLKNKIRQDRSHGWSI